jgi:hypothetical protein
MKARTLLVGLLAVTSAAIIAQSTGDFQRERNGKTDAAKNAHEGKAPPAMAFESWLNMPKPPKNWEALKGSVILVDFWAHW